MINSETLITWKVAPDTEAKTLDMDSIQSCELPPTRKRLSANFQSLLESEIASRGLSDLHAFELNRVFMDIYSYHHPEGFNQKIFMDATEYYLDRYVEDVKLFDDLNRLTATIFPLLFEEVR